MDGGDRSNPGTASDGSSQCDKCGEAPRAVLHGNEGEKGRVGWNPAIQG